MNDKYQGLGSAIYAAYNKVSTIYLQCNNPVSQQSFDNNEFLPVYWGKPRIVAADDTILAYHCPINKCWINTKAKTSWINQSAVPKSGLLEIKSSLRDFLDMVG